MRFTNTAVGLAFFIGATVGAVLTLSVFSNTALNVNNGSSRKLSITENIDGAGTGANSLRTIEPPVDEGAETGERRHAFVCITGQIQRLELDMKMRTLLDPLVKEGYLVDVALVMTENTNDKAYFANRDEKKVPSSKWSSFAAASSFLQQHGFNVVTPEPIVTTKKPPVPEVFVNAIDRKKPSDRRKSGESAARQFETLSKCHQVMINAAADKQTAVLSDSNVEVKSHASFSYDVILRIRDDAAPVTPLTSHALDPLDLYENESGGGMIFANECLQWWGGVNDRFAIVSPAAAESYFLGPKNRFFHPNATFDAAYLKRIVNTETFLFDTYRRLNVTVVSTNKIPYILMYEYDEQGNLIVIRREFTEVICPRK
jgi:hypothetical protein